MAVMKVRTVPDPVLREKCKKISRIDKSILKLVDDMFDTMYEYNGVGLAAPQVGVPLRLVVIRMPEDDAEEIVLINPEIVKKSGEREVTEACLSVPGYSGLVKRAEKVTIKGRDVTGKEIRYKGEGLLAQAFEHETDHLSGTLYTDLIESDDKLFKPSDAGESSSEEEFQG